MKLYSIGELSVLSQIKPHTIRIWEQRYKLLVPSRSEGNTRYYSEFQLMKLLNVALLNKSGVKISHIANYSDKELIEKASEVTQNNHSIEVAVEQFMVASMQFDQQKTENLFRKYIEQHGINDTYEKIIFPYLRIVGNLWVNGKITPGHEHFFTNLCKQNLFSVIDQLPFKIKNKSKIILSLPEWDLHELGILYYNYLFKQSGYECTYLGQAVPAIDVIQTAKTINAQYIISTFIGPTSRKQVNKYIDELMSQLSSVELIISGPQLNFIIDDRKGRITIFNSMKLLKEKFNLK